MKINFGVAAVYHCAGGPVENMGLFRPGAHGRRARNFAQGTCHRKNICKKCILGVDKCIPIVYNKDIK